MQIRGGVPGEGTVPRRGRRGLLEKVGRRTPGSARRGRRTGRGGTLPVYLRTAYGDGYRAGTPAEYSESIPKGDIVRPGERWGDVHVAGVSGAARRRAGSTADDFADGGDQGLREVRGTRGADAVQGAHVAYVRGRPGGEAARYLIPTIGGGAVRGFEPVPRSTRRAVPRYDAARGTEKASAGTGNQEGRALPVRARGCRSRCSDVRERSGDVISPSWLPLSVLEHGSSIASRPPDRLTRSPPSPQEPSTGRGVAQEGLLEALRTSSGARIHRDSPSKPGEGLAAQTGAQTGGGGLRGRAAGAPGGARPAT